MFSQKSNNDNDTQNNLNVFVDLETRQVFVPSTSCDGQMKLVPIHIPFENSPLRIALPEDMTTTQTKTRTLAQVKRQLAEKKKKVVQKACTNVNYQTDYTKPSNIAPRCVDGDTNDPSCSSDYSNVMLSNHLSLSCLSNTESPVSNNGDSSKRKQSSYEVHGNDIQAALQSLPMHSLQGSGSIFDKQSNVALDDQYFQAKKSKPDTFVNLQLVVNELNGSNPTDNSSKMLEFPTEMECAEQNINQQSNIMTELLHVKQQRRGRRPVPSKSSFSSAKNPPQICNCRRQAMLKCKRCGALCHKDCISSDYLCFECLTAESIG